MAAIASLDLPSSRRARTTSNLRPYRICSSKTVVHDIFHDSSIQGI